MPQRTIRFSETTLQQIQQAAKQKGFTSTAAMILHALDQELSSEDEVEQRIAATLDRIRGDLSRCNGYSKLCSHSSIPSPRHC